MEIFQQAQEIRFIFTLYYDFKSIAEYRFLFVISDQIFINSGQINKLNKYVNRHIV